MDPHDPRWREHLDIVTAWGEASAANGTPLPTDEQLWAAARRRQDLNLPARIDDDLLEQLRDAFNARRRPTRVDLQAVADTLNAHGLPAQVEHTGGNTATLYAGQQRIGPDGEPRWSVSVGPGWFDAPGRRRPAADTGELHIGPDDDSWVIGVPEYATTSQIAELIIAVAREADARRARFAATVAAARQAVWKVFAVAFPDGSTDQLQGLDAPLAAELDRLLTRWLERHWPAFHTVPRHLSAADHANPETHEPPPGAAGPAAHPTARSKGITR